VGFIGAIKSGFRNRINFSGRASRSEFWNYSLFTILFFVFSIVFLLALNIDVKNVAAPFMFVCILVLGTIIPGFALTARRLHDLDRSGWWIIVIVVPLLGQLTFLVWMFMRGTRGVNRFGEDPLEAKTAVVAAAA
jgi:uncharacterized membrane protein YhaH (DUF805 family)